MDLKVRYERVIFLGTLVSKNITRLHRKHVYVIFITFCGIITTLLVRQLKNDYMISAVEPWRPLKPFDQQFTTTTFPTDIRHNWNESSNPYLALFLLSAIGSYTTTYVDYQRDIKLIGWLAAKHKNASLKCCFLLTNKTVSEFYNPILSYHKRSRLIASQIACPINNFSDIDGVDIQLAASKCSTNAHSYMKPYLPKRTVNEDSFAVCLKLVYGNVNNKLFIDWLEFYREMKVDKIFMFTYNITITTNSIINHYVQLGLVERHPYDYPLKFTRMVGQKKMSYFEDERVLLIDCLQRSSVYKYMTVVDMDEFLLPREHDDFKEMMTYLMQTNPRAAGFKITPYLFVKDVGPDRSAPINGSDIVKYFLRTKAITNNRSRSKNIILPSRITLERFTTHTFQPSKGYTREKIDPLVASINHYRMCYANMKGICDTKLTTDKFILKFVEKFKNRTWYPSE